MYKVKESKFVLFLFEMLVNYMETMTNIINLYAII